MLLLFDVYLTWARIEKQTSSDPSADDPSNRNFLLLAQQPIVFQYMFFRTCPYLLPSHGITSNIKIGFSASLRALNPRFPPLHPHPNFIPFLPPRSFQSGPSLSATQLRLHRTPRLLLYKALSHTHGHLGLRRTCRGTQSRLGGGRQ